MTCSAQIILHSVTEHSPPIATMQLRFPKFILAEFNTHRVFSRNASSSRAIPVERLIKDVIDDPVIPTFWGKNRPGMAATEECDARVDLTSFALRDLSREDAWAICLETTINQSRAFAAAGYHKQIVNRILEPFCHVNVVVTSTEWENFFALRCHSGAQPEMRELAEAMRAALVASAPQLLPPGQWHLPYVSLPGGNGISKDDLQQINEAIKRTTYPGICNAGWLEIQNSAMLGLCLRISTARCASVSYKTVEGELMTVERALHIYGDLAGARPMHASPMEHQATPDEWHNFGQGCWAAPERHGNFRGWVQHRKLLTGESA